MEMVDKFISSPQHFLPAGMLDSEVHEVIEIMERFQMRQRNLCAQMEQVADSLPLDADPSLCMRIARSLLPTLASAHEFQVQHFIPVVRSALGEFGNLDAVAERLHSEYNENEMLAEEVAEELSQWGICGETHSAEATGYMLRGCFISLTRHLDFERIALIEPVKTRLSRLEDSANQEQ